MRIQTCSNCHSTFPSQVVIDGKTLNLSKRKTCLTCNPYNSDKGKSFRQRSWTDAQLIEAVNTSSSLTEILIKLSLRPAGGAHSHIKKHIQRLNLDITHYSKIYEERRDAARYLGLQSKITYYVTKPFLTNAKLATVLYTN